MKAKDKKIKTRCPKNNKGKKAATKLEIPIPAAVTAEIVHCSPRTVKAVRTGERSTKGKIGEQVAAVDDLLKTGINALITEVQNLVKL